jgi:hypothetical protein
MKQFSKSVLAAALLVAAGAANASIYYGTTVANSANNEAFLSVYDKSQQLTFTLDLGVTFAELLTNINNAAYFKNVDLSADANWAAFSATMDATQTFYSVAVANDSKQIATAAAAPDAWANLTVARNGGTAIKVHVGQINVGQLADNPGETIGNTAANLSSLVSDADTPKTGQHNQDKPASNLWGSNDSWNTNIAFGTSGDFWYLNGKNTPTLAAFKFTLSGNSLVASEVSNVPVPAAVWMFGTGLMAMFGLNRRKSTTV